MNTDFYKIQNEENFRNKQINEIKNILEYKKIKAYGIYYNVHHNCLVDGESRKIDNDKFMSQIQEESVEMYNNNYRVQYIVKNTRKITVGRKKTEEKFIVERIMENKFLYKLINDIKILENINTELCNGIYKQITITPFKYRNVQIMVNFLYRTIKKIRSISINFIITDQYSTKKYTMAFANKKEILEQFKTYKDIQKFNTKFIVIYLRGFEVITK